MRIIMKAAASTSDVEEDAVDSKPLLEEDEKNSALGSLSLPNRSLWPWIVHFLLFSTALVTIIVNLRKGPDCIQRQSHYCMSLRFSLHSLAALIKAPH